MGGGRGPFLGAGDFFCPSHPPVSSSPSWPLPTQARLKAGEPRVFCLRSTGGVHRRLACVDSACPAVSRANTALCVLYNAGDVYHRLSCAARIAVLEDGEHGVVPCLVGVSSGGCIFQAVSFCRLACAAAREPAYRRANPVRVLCSGYGLGFALLTELTLGEPCGSPQLGYTEARPRYRSGNPVK